LAAAERRRIGRVVKLALAIALEATSQAGEDPAELASVFSSSGGDGHNCHELCQALSLAGREFRRRALPTPVHNAGRGLLEHRHGRHGRVECALRIRRELHAGLLEALTQVVVDQVPVLLVAYDSEYPQPLHAKRPIPDTFGVAMVLTPQRRVRRSREWTGRSATWSAIDSRTRTWRRCAARSAARRTAAAPPAGGAKPAERRFSSYLDVSRLEVRIEPCA